MIEFRKVNKWFGSLHVLNDIDLTVEAGTVVVVCGPSGSGKSTLIRCINRLESIQSGDIIVDAVSLSDANLDAAKLRANVGMVFQSFNLYPHMTVVRNITLAPIKVKGLAPAEAEKSPENFWSASASLTKPMPTPPIFPAASSSESPSPAPWR